MTSGGQFQADPSAISTAAAAFDKESGPIGDTAKQLDAIKGSGSNSGKAYSAQGKAYHDAVTTALEKLITTFGEKTEWISGALSATGQSYSSSDTGGAQQLNTSGRGA